METTITILLKDFDELREKVNTKIKNIKNTKKILLKYNLKCNQV